MQRDLALIDTDASGTCPAGVRLPVSGLGLDPVLARMSHGPRVFYAVLNGEAVGVAGFLDITDTTAEIGYGVSPDRRGEGLAHDIATALQQLALREGLTGLRARSAVENAASGAVLAKAGFVKVSQRADPEMGLIQFWEWAAPPSAGAP